MISIQKVIFPGIAAGCLFVVFVVSMIANPTIALASVPRTDPTAGAVAAVAVANPKTDANAPAENANAAQAQAGQPAVQDPSSAGTSAESCPLSQSYPEKVRQWCGLIEQYAAENNLDPNLLASVMLQESGGNPRAYSKSGAVGLLQVMPNDGLASGFMCINGPCFSSRPSTEQLYDPEFNVSYGAKMLAGLIQKYGDIREGLRAYGPINMGYRYADIILSLMNRYQQ